MPGSLDPRESETIHWRRSHTRSRRRLAALGRPEPPQLLEPPEPILAAIALPQTGNLSAAPGFGGIVGPKRETGDALGTRFPELRLRVRHPRMLTRKNRMGMTPRVLTTGAAAARNADRSK